MVIIIREYRYELLIEKNILTVVTLWDTETFEKLATFEGFNDKIVSIAFSRDGKFLATGN